MANEIQIISQLRISGGGGNNLPTNFFYASLPAQFTANASSATGQGSTPGGVLCAITGTQISLTTLTAKGGWAFIQNEDSINFVSIGMYDGAHYHPMLDLLPQEYIIIRLSSLLGQELTGTSIFSSGDSLMIKADTAACWVVVHAFNK
jgi:hypothetical protein